MEPFNLDKQHGRRLSKIIADLLTRELKGKRIVRGDFTPVLKIISFEISDDPNDEYFCGKLMMKVEQMGTVGGGDSTFKFSYLPPQSQRFDDYTIEGQRFTCGGFSCLATEWNDLRDDKKRQELGRLVEKHQRQIKRLVTETMGGITVDWDYFQRCIFRNGVCQETKDTMLCLLLAMGILSTGYGWEVYEDLLDYTCRQYPLEYDNCRLYFTREEEARELISVLTAQAERIDKRHRRDVESHIFEVVRRS